MHRVLASIVESAPLDTLRNSVVLVATGAGAMQLRTTLERLVLERGRGAPAVLGLPIIATREQWYRLMHARLGLAASYLSELEREVILGAAAARARALGHTPPFELRAGLLLEILGLYDDLHRHLRDIDAFERILVDELEPGCEVDHGAARLLRQTHFLVAAFRAYRRHLETADLFDEVRLGERLRAVPLRPALERVIVTLPDAAADPASGLWPADFDLLTRLEGLWRVDVVATDAVLDAGFRDRLQDLLPGAEDVRWRDVDRAEPVLRQPSAEPVRSFSVTRDREEELVSFARAVKRESVTPDGGGERRVSGRTALLFQRPLPYLYLAGPVLGGAGIPFQAVDALPLAAEPFAATLDLVFACVESGFAPIDLLRLLRSPDLRFVTDGVAVGRQDVAVLERALGPRPPDDLRGRMTTLRSGEPGSPDGKAAPDGAARAAGAALEVLDDLRTLAGEDAASVLLAGLLEFLETHLGDPSPDEALAARQQAARAAILGAIRALREAHRRFDDPRCGLGEVASRIRRWIEAQTFAPRRGTAGVQLVDARAARYGDFDVVRLAGLVEDDWPARPRRNIFYPAGLLAKLGWSGEANRLAAARAAFVDLLHLPRARVSLSAFTLDEDRLVSPSPLLDRIDDIDLRVVPAPDDSPGRISIDEAISSEPVASAVVSGLAADWLALRRGRRPRTSPAFHGQARSVMADAYGVTSVEQYLACPFAYFANRVLDIDGEREAGTVLSPLERGRFLHALLRAFYAAWTATDEGSITPGNLAAARRLFGRTVDEALQTLPQPERRTERARLMGSALATGLGERLFRIELDRPGRVVERLLEFTLDVEWETAAEGARRPVWIRGVADRIDMLDDGTFRLIDYKAGRAPVRARAVQLPVYAACAEQRLDQYRGKAWRAASAAYVALGERPAYVPLAGRGADLADRLADGRHRFMQAIASIERGRFPPAPAARMLCQTCSYTSVCRQEYVDDR